MTSVAIFIGIFFTIGIAVGVITVIALSALRHDRRHSGARQDTWTGHQDEESPDPAPAFGWAGAPVSPHSWRRWDEDD